MKAEQHPLIRSLRIFAGNLPPRMVALRSDFDAAHAAFMAATREEHLLADAAWSDPELLGALVPRIIELRQTIRESRKAMGDAVDLAAAVRTADLFVDREPPLSAMRTMVAMNEGTLHATALETPLTDADRARIRRRRS